MIREERLALLGPEVVAHIHEVVDAAPDPSPELVEELRRIMTRPAGGTRSQRLEDAELLLRSDGLIKPPPTADAA